MATETYEEHKARHELLHGYLDELVADWITQTGNLPSRCTVVQLLEWSFEQSRNPTTREQ